MTDRPILFSAPMVRALLEGRKTQTRRPLKPQPFIDQNGNFCSPARNGKIWNWGQHTNGRPCVRNYIAEHVPVAIGDRLWVREAWHAARSLDSTPPRDIPRDADIEYAATARSYAEIGLKGKLRPGMFMPRWASRLTLEVIDVRVERLQDISEQDAIAEGIYLFLGDGGGYKFQPGEQEFDTAVEAYRDLWNHINGPGAWDKNPWVAAYTFGVIPQNIDQIERAA